MRKLGLDFGTKNCGFAITDELGIIASPIENFSYENGNFEHVFNRINYWIEFYENKVDTLVIGLPTNAFTNTNNPRTTLVLDFKNYITNRLNKEVKIVLFDERFTTKIAISTLKNQAKLKGAQIKKIKDKISAVIILEDYLKTL